MNMTIQDLLNKVKVALNIRTLGASVSLGNELLTGRSHVFGKVTRHFIAVWLLGLLILMSGTWFLFDTVNAFYDLDNKTIAYKSLIEDVAQKERQLEKIKAEHATVLELAKFSPTSQTDLIESLSEAHRRSNMVVNKMTVGLPSNPDLISVESEGNYAALKMTLAELSNLSPSIDMRSVTISYQPSKGMLTLIAVLKFAAPPKVANPSSISNAAYMDGAGIYHSSFFKKVELPSGSTSSSGKSPPKQSVESGAGRLSQAGSSSSQTSSTDRNPFYMPTPQNAGVDGSGGVKADMGNGFNGQTTRESGVYALGCMAMPTRSKEACIFQLSDGANIVVNLGDKIESNLRLVKITKEKVTIAIDKKRSTFKLGERIR